METTQPQKIKSKRDKKGALETIYSKSLITRSITLPVVSIGKNIQEMIEKNVVFLFEGKCIVEGFVKPNSCRIITYSSGILTGSNIQFDVVFQCEICFRLL